MPDVRLPAQEFYVVPYPPPAENGNDDIARYGGKAAYEGWGHAKLTIPAHAATMRGGFRQTNIPCQNPRFEDEPVLHVDPVAESRRRRISPNGCCRRSPLSSGTVCWFEVRQTSIVMRLSAMNSDRFST